MKDMSTRQDVDEALGQQTALLFKHSTRCPISAAAREQMDQFLDRNPDAPLYIVDVNEATEASEYLAEKTGIQHQSPQVILARNGSAAWHANHFEIRADDVQQKLEAAA